MVKAINFRGLKALGIALKVYMSEQNLSMTRKYVFAFAFTRGLIVHGVLRANIKMEARPILLFAFPPLAERLKERSLVGKGGVFDKCQLKLLPSRVSLLIR